MNLGFVNNHVRLIMKKEEKIITIILMQAMLKQGERGIRMGFRIIEITVIQEEGIISKIFINNIPKKKKEGKCLKNDKINFKNLLV